MWLYFFHQFLGVEVLIMLLPVVVLKSFSGLSLLSTIPLLIFIVIKFYCWLAMISLYRAEKREEDRIIFGKHYFQNVLLAMTPNTRLTMPQSPGITTTATMPYEQFL
jgi:hypothetical protein